MEVTINSLKQDLEAQLEQLSETIRSHETKLLTAKERYLKIQGALEILSILEQNSGSDREGDLSSALIDL